MGESESSYSIENQSEMPSTTATTLPKFDVFLSFRGFDTRRNFISFLYKELLRKKIRTFKDDKELESGQKITPELVRAIQESKLAVVVISANYAASTWCLDELVHIMDFENNKLLTVMPIFYGVDPCHVRWQKGEVAEQFKKHEAREDHEKVLSWRQALTNLASISGNCSSECKDDSELVDKITEKISMTIAETRTSNGSNLAGINAHMKALSRLLDSMSKKEVRVIGIWARGGKCRSALAKHVYQEMSQDFESHCFLENVKRISQHRHLWHLRDEILLRIPEESLRHKNQRVLLVADDVSTLEQVDALAEDFNCFGPGSIVIITTQDKQLLRSYNIERVYEAEHLRFLSIFRQLAFKKKRDISAAFGRATNLAVELLGCLCVRSGYEKVLDSIY